MSYTEILKTMGISETILTEKEYTEAVEYSRRKAKLTGQNEDYVRLLLPDVIKEKLFSRFTVNLAIARS